MKSDRHPTRRVLLLAAGAFLLEDVTRLEAKQPHRLAFLAGGSRASNEPYIGAFRDGLRALGYTEEDVSLEVRYADGYYERLTTLATELVKLAPEVIVAGSPPAAKALKQATATIPIVIASSSDPVGAGLVASLAKPGGNVTGLSVMQEDLIGKRLELLKTTVRHSSRIAMLLNPANPSAAGVLRSAQAAALTLQIELRPIELRTPQEVDGAFQKIANEKLDGVIETGEPILFVAKNRIVDLAAKFRLPAIYAFRDFAAAGG